MGWYPGQLVLVSSRADQIGHGRLRYQQEVAGLAVVGGMLDLHVDGDGVINLAIASARDRRGSRPQHRQGDRRRAGRGFR
jgi:Zn-dependent metalloprotease